MSEKELLLSISDIISKNVKVLERRIDRVEASLSNKIDGVDRRVDNISLRLENIIEPRLSNIESCYTSTYDKYKDGAEKIETLEMNMQVVQSVVKEHGEKLNVLTA